MIKRIQLRGISRSPSDRLTDDGGVAESLNAYLDNSEQAPVIVPEDITGDLGLGDAKADRVFIHKTLHYRNLLWVIGNEVMSGSGTILTLGASEAVKDIASLGNVVIVATDSNMYYLLYDIPGKRYILQGSGIPLPTLMVTSEESYAISEEYWLHRANTTAQPSQDLMLGDNWNELKEDGTNAEGMAANLAASIKSRYEEYESAAAGYTKPVVMRYAIRLYNGSLITSVPYLVGGGYVNGFKSIIAKYEWVEGYEYDVNDNPVNQERISIEYTKGSYKPYVRLLDFSAEEIASWKDIVQSIDVYISTEIEPDLTCVQVRGRSASYAESTAYIDMGTDKKAKDRILEKSVFFKIASYDLNDEEAVARLREGVALDAITSGDELMNNHERLDPSLDNMMPDSMIPSHMSTYNASLLLSGISTKITSGVKTLMALEGTSNDNYVWTARFYIAGASGSANVLARDEKDSIYIAGPKAYAWVCHPNVNCKSAVICSDEDDVVEIPMEPHPYLPCSYGYLGRQLLKEYTHSDGQLASSNRTRPEANVISQANKVLLSEMENPYVFPLGRRYTFEAEVLNVAVATTALSQGQFGQFPLYVFTADGIWALETGADGSFVSSKPLSREVCVNPDSVTSIDQAVIFVTDKGVMLLQGSQITELSPYMNGRHYTIEESAKNIIKCQSGFCNYLDVLSDATPFMAFIREASVAYDYAGKRLIFVNPDEAYQYTYSLGTNTWHKIAHGYRLTQVLNAYPQCLIAAEKEDGTSLVLDFTTVLDSSVKQYTERAVIATRPFDLAEPDVLKTITDVRVRGQFPRGAVKFILLGSNDGINFHTVSTLRGKSWKLFRMIILADLEQHERVSWVDIQYETRFTNRLR